MTYVTTEGVAVAMCNAVLARGTVTTEGLGAFLVGVNRALRADLNLGIHNARSVRFWTDKRIDAWVRGDASPADREEWPNVWALLRQ